MREMTQKEIVAYKRFFQAIILRAINDLRRHSGDLRRDAARFFFSTAPEEVEWYTWICEGAEMRPEKLREQCRMIYKNQKKK